MTLKKMVNGVEVDMTPEEEAELRFAWANAMLPVVPQSVTKFQAKAALHLAGLLDSVEPLMASPDTPQLARLAWQDAQEFRRTSPTVLAMAQSLGLSDSQLDELFITAAGIDA